MKRFLLLCIIIATILVSLPTRATDPHGTIQMNHAIVDENGLIYANHRFTGGLYILRYTGAVPLD